MINSKFSIVVILQTGTLINLQLQKILEHSYKILEVNKKSLIKHNRNEIIKSVLRSDTVCVCVWSKGKFAI